MYFSTVEKGCSERLYKNMTSAEMKKTVQELTAADNLCAASDPFGTADKIVGLGNDAVPVIREVLENPHGKYGPCRLNVLALALRKYADAGDEAARTILRNMAGGALRNSIMSLGCQGGADLAISIAYEWDKSGTEAVPLAPTQGDRNPDEAERVIHPVRRKSTEVSPGNIRERHISWRNVSVMSCFVLIIFVAMPATMLVVGCRYAEDGWGVFLLIIGGLLAFVGIVGTLSVLWDEFIKALQRRSRLQTCNVCHTLQPHVWCSQWPLSSGLNTTLLLVLAMAVTQLFNQTIGLSMAAQSSIFILAAVPLSAGLLGLIYIMVGRWKCTCCSAPARMPKSPASGLQDRVAEQSQCSGAATIGGNMDATPSASQWYRTHSDTLHVTQIVAVLPPETAVPARVGNLVPAGAPGVAFSNATWAATAVLLDGTPEQAGPFVFAKATNVVEVLKGQPVSIAFAYYRMNHGGLFQLFVEVDTPSVRSRINDRYVSERLFNLDDSEDLDLLRQLCSREFLEVCFVAPGEKGPCTGYFGFKIGIPASVRDALTKELNDLIGYNRGLRSRNSQAAIAQYNNENPMDSTPVLSRELATEHFRQEEDPVPQAASARSIADSGIVKR